MHLPIDITFAQAVFDVSLILIGFIGKSFVQFRLPASLICLIIEMAKWYLKTHPKGKEIAKCSKIDERLTKLYPDAIG